MTGSDPANVDPLPLSYGLPPITGPALVVAALLLAAVGIAADTTGRISGGFVAAVLLAGAAWVGGGPTLTAGPQGITIRQIFTRRHLRWADIVAVRSDDRRRSRALELETANELVVVSGSLLGRRSVTEVSEAVSALWEQFRQGATPELPD